MKNRLIKLFEGKTFRRYVIITAVAAVYFFGLRNLRTVVFSGFMHPDRISSIESHPGLEVQKVEKRAIVFKHISKSGNNSFREWKLIIPFGIYFLISVTGLIIIGAPYKYHLILAVCHAVAGAITGFSLVMAETGSTEWLMGGDMMARYFIPFCSLGLIALAFKSGREQ